MTTNTTIIATLPPSNSNTRKQCPSSQLDLVVAKPHFYALTDKPLPSPNTSNHNNDSTTARLDRVDSGYTSSNNLTHISSSHNDDSDDRGQSSLYDDIAYIDQKYYHHHHHHHHHHPQQQKEPALPSLEPPVEKPFTFLDACGVLNRSMQEIDASARRLINLSPNISCFKMIRRLNLSHNALARLPEAIGRLESLEYLCLAYNQLEELPETIGHLSNMTELDISHNRVRDLTPCFRLGSKKLHTIHAENNLVGQLSYHIRNMTHLASFNLSDNPITVLPAEIAQLPYLRHMLLRACPLIGNMTHTLQHDPPSLREICARIALRRQLDTTRLLPDHLSAYLATAKPCSSCRGPYFDTYVTRGQWIEKADGLVPLEHRLCSAHWTDEDSRILDMFSSGQHMAVVPPSISSSGRREEVATVAEEQQIPATTSASTTADRWRTTQKRVNTHRWLATKLKRPA